LAELAEAAGLTVSTVERILTTVRDEPCLLGDEAAEGINSELLKHWNLPVAASGDGSEDRA
jgi:hypothetical protein